MITERIEKIDTKTEDLEAIKRFFVDPENAKSAEDLALVGEKTILAMAQIYATGGNIEKMAPDIKDWLSNPKGSNSDFEQTVGEVLKREVKTRRFDQRFMGQIHPQGNKVGIIGNLVAAYMNTNRIFSGVSQSEATMEHVSVRWLAKMFGYESSKSGGNLTTGGTEANIQAFWIAREKALGKIHLKDVENNQPMYVFASEQRHYSVDKACQILGIRLITVGSDNFKINLKGLESKINNIKEGNGLVIAVVGIAGETETGMVEDLQGLAEIAKKNNTFFHVDAAYGGPFVLSRAGGVFKGISEADSITVDPHKMLYTPYPAGALILKDKNDHFLISRDHQVNYLRNVVPRVIGSMSSAGVISTWATLKLFGAEGITSLLDHTLDLVDFAYKRASKSKVLRPLYEPELNTLLMGLTKEFKDGWRSKGLSDQQIDKEVILMETEVFDRMNPGDNYIAINTNTDEDPDTKYKFSVFRYIGVHPYTTEKDVEASISGLESVLTQRLSAKLEELKNKFLSPPEQ